MTPRWRTWVGTAAAILVAGLLGGCGGSGTQPSAASGVLPGAHTRSSVVTGAAATATTTTVPVALATTTGTTSTDALPGTNRPEIYLGDMNTPEQFILGQLYRDVLESQGYLVNLNRNIGATAVSQAALGDGILDVYPQYLNEYDSQIAGLSAHFSSLRAAFSAGQAYATAHGETLLTPTPFSDTAGIAVLTQFARAHHLRTLAGLGRVQSSLVLGSPIEFSAIPSGLPALEQAYRFTPALTAAVNIGDQYLDLRVGAVNAAYVQTTDWQLQAPTYTTLADPRHVFGFGNVVPVVSTSTIAAEGPIFVEAIDQVDALLTTSVMRGLTAELASSPDPAQTASTVASEFLQGYGLAPPPPWATVTGTTTTPLSVTAVGAVAPTGVAGAGGTAGTSGPAGGAAAGSRTARPRSRERPKS
ncbi:glycine betaine ABC transporter substrate-binding protein [Conexibacter sp. DBS9H8]|uniref:ABC transporter substrate-binding protein n=1 Tax=Conexibacter sp. DBS9H8 TaxID=2937801 RepID=UPI00200F6C24|nr:glycine betaine ABC transporter substrate-binding protein [Conexibacter sp. DBS9H8]